MKLTSREVMLSVITGIVVLIGFSYWFGKPKIAAWKELTVNQQTLKRRLEISERLLGQRGQWDERIDALRIKLSKYPLNKDVTADYLKILERVAKDNKLSLIRRKPQKEKHHGDLYELAIDCTWEGNLEALVRFLYALEQENVAMDMEELTVTLVPGGKGRLKGNFTLMCLYTRSSDKTPEGRETKIGMEKKKPRQKKTAKDIK